MLLSTTADYALRIMIVLSESDGSPITSEKIASMTKVPTDYSVKVLQMLARAGLVRAQRGRGGGFQIDCDPNVTTLLDVVDAIDPLKRITSCPLSREMHTEQLCPLHKKLDDVIVQLQESFRNMTLKGVTEGSVGPALCQPAASEEAAGEEATGETDHAPAGHSPIPMARRG